MDLLRLYPRSLAWLGAIVYLELLLWLASRMP